MSYSEMQEVMTQEANQREGIMSDMTRSPDCIMNCTRTKLMEICKCFLVRTDDFQQLSVDNSEMLDYFTVIYNDLERVYFHLKAGGLLSNSSRNELRMLIKESEQMASMQLDLEHYNEELKLLKQNITYQE